MMCRHLEHDGSQDLIRFILFDYFHLPLSNLLLCSQLCYVSFCSSFEDKMNVETKMIFDEHNREIKIVIGNEIMLVDNDVSS